MMNSLALEGNEMKLLTGQAGPNIALYAKISSLATWAIVAITAALVGFLAFNPAISGKNVGVGLLWVVVMIYILKDVGHIIGAGMTSAPVALALSLPLTAASLGWLVLTSVGSENMYYGMLTAAVFVALPTQLILRLIVFIELKIRGVK